MEDFEFYDLYDDFSEEENKEMIEVFEDSIRFSHCCAETKFENYKMSSDIEKLRSMNGNMAKMLLYLLIFLPNTNSKKSKRDALVSLKNTDDSCYIFFCLLRLAGLGERDCKICDRIDKSEVNRFKGKICLNCQKIIMTLDKDKKSVPVETETEALFRHLRNIIAHGNFEIVKDVLIGFDYNKDKSQCTAIIKIKPYNIINAITNKEYFDNIKQHLL